MRKRSAFLVLSLLMPAALSLTSCMDRVKELYGEDEYLRGSLVDYYFTGRNDFEDKAVMANDVLPPVAVNDGYALGDIDKEVAGRMVLLDAGGRNNQRLPCGSAPHGAELSREGFRENCLHEREGPLLRGRDCLQDL